MRRLRSRGRRRRRYDGVGTRLPAGAIILALVALAGSQEVQAFARKAVDRLLETNKCHRCNLRDVHLARRSLRGADLSGAYLIRADLAGADLSGADLRGAWLWRTNFRKANLEGATLRGAQLIEADLRKANLRGADLRGASLARAELAGANVRTANFAATKLQGAKLGLVGGLVPEQLPAACGDSDTILPVRMSLPTCRGAGR